MWAWFTASAVWIFIASSLGLVLLLFSRGRARSKIAKAAPGKLRRIIPAGLTAAFLGLIAGALVAIVLSSDGIYSIVTTETIQRWLLEHGTRIIIILLVGTASWYALQKFLPPLVRRAMARPVPGESREGRKRRAATLHAVFMGAGKLIIVLLILFMVLSELGISIGPILAGFGIAGIKSFRLYGFQPSYALMLGDTGGDNRRRFRDISGRLYLLLCWARSKRLHVPTRQVRSTAPAIHGKPSVWFL